LLTGFVGGIAVFQNNNTNKIAEEEVYRSISHLDDVWNLMEAQEHQKIAAKDFLFVQRGLKEKKTEYFRDKERWEKKYQIYLARSCEYAKPLLDMYYENMEKYNSTVEKAFDGYEQGVDLETLQKKVTEADKYAEIAHENALKPIIEHVYKVHIEPAKENIAKGINKTAIVTIIVSTVAVFVAVGLGLFISRSISNPLYILQKKIEMIGKGNLDIRAEVKSNDEIGKLAVSFNKMAEDLSKTTVSRDKLDVANQQLRSEIAERKQAEQELRKIHEQLVEASRHAGMAEVATNVLHNVGNILNSINVTSTLVREKVSNLRVAKLKKLSDMLNEHADDLGTYLAEDSKGKHVPVYLTEIAAFLNDEQVDIIDKLGFLTENINHIKGIISVQQSCAKVSDLEVSTSIEKLIENAIQINSAGLERHGAKLECEIAELGMIEIDKQRVLQILVNLINNAKYALSGSGKEDKVLTIRAYKHGEDRMRIEVADNGIGIAEENMARIFEHGFTTKQNGHGFGLHSGALTAKGMGGLLTVHSEGPGQGATFTLELPYKVAEVMV